MSKKNKNIEPHVIQLYDKCLTYYEAFYNAIIEKKNDIRLFSSTEWLNLRRELIASHVYDNVVYFHHNLKAYLEKVIISIKNV